jgi:3-deoxy-D-manno-octulosonic-acid transferase
VRFYGWAANIYAMFNPKAKLWAEGRKSTARLLQQPLPPGYSQAKNRLWFHCASLGEFEQARPLIEAVKQQPDTSVLLTFFSPSGYEVRKDDALADIVCYLPNDTARNAKNFIATMKPTKVYWTKYDFWFHHIQELNRNSIPVFLFSAIFRKEQVFFKPYGSLFRKLLTYFSHIFVQDKESCALLKGIGITNVSLSNDTRFDRVITIAGKQYQNPVLEAFVHGKEVIVAGSTWQADEILLLNYINSDAGKKYKYIIAPHNISESQIVAFENNCGLVSLRYSKATNINVKGAQVLIIDNYGMLSALYRYGKIAYIGGAFGTSVHNVLEAAVYGLPVVFGPNYTRSRECMELLDAKGGFTFTAQHELHSIFQQLNTDNNAALSGANAGNYVYAHRGGTAEILSNT